jgi:hypothetical protein
MHGGRGMMPSPAASGIHCKHCGGALGRDGDVWYHINPESAALCAETRPTAEVFPDLEGGATP